MPVQQDQLTPTNTNTNFETFNAELPTSNTDWADRVLHNGTDILKATLWGKSGQPITPKFKYYQTNGVEKVSYTPEQSQLLDVCYDATNNKYYTVRLINNLTLSGVGPDPDDNFSLPTNTISPDSNKWFATTNEINSTVFPLPHPKNNQGQFVRESGTLSIAGLLNRYMRSRYVFNSDFEATLDFNATTVTGALTSKLQVSAIDPSTGNHIYGVGITRVAGTNLFFNTKVSNFSKLSTASLLGLYLEPDAIPSGVVTWSFEKIAVGTWQLTNSLGLNANTPTPSDIPTYLNPVTSGIQTVISGGASASIGDIFNFTTISEVDTRPLTSGTLYLSKAGSSFSSSNSANFTESISWPSSQAILIYGLGGSGTVITADNFNITTGTPLYENYPLLSIERVNEQGAVQSSVISNFDVLQSNSTLSNLISGTIGLAVSPSQILYTKVFDRIYSFTATGTFTGITTSGSVGITQSVSGVIPSSGITSFMYNGLASTSLNYVTFDTNTNEVRYKSLSSSQPPTPIAKEIFLDVPDFNEHRTASGTKPYQFYLHATDNNSLFYIRKNGNTNVNTTKITSGATGVISSPTLTDSSKNFITSNVKKGDLVAGTSGAFSGITVVVKTVVNATTLELMDRNTGAIPTITAGTYSYTIRGNAELLQFNIDPTISAFSAVNADDYSLQAGTNDTATVSVEVINAWGESLNGKNVAFQLVQGDGVINPPSAVTSGAGVATTQYTAGAAAGPVQIQVTISD
jgi:hypothetical protein